MVKSDACSALIKILTDLGFTVNKGRGGHKVFDHHAISDFHGSNFNCGHGNNPQVKKPYTKKVLKVIEKYEAELKTYLGEPDEN